MGYRNESTAKTKRSDVYRPLFSQLRCNPDDNLRKDYGDIKELADQIRSAGRLIKPLVGLVKNGEFWVKGDGFRRYFALQLIHKEDGVDMECLFMPEPPGITSQERLRNMFLHSEGKQLTVLEQAAGIKRMLENPDAPDMSLNKLAKTLGKSNAYLSRLNRLNNAKPELISLIESGEISGTTAIDLLVKGQEDEFLKSYGKGDFGTAPQAPSIMDENLTVDAGANNLDTSNSGTGKKKAGRVTDTGKTSRIRPKDILKPKVEEAEQNSWMLLKRFIKGYEGKPGTPEGQKIMAFIGKLMDNKLTEKDFKRIFKN